MKRSFPDKQVQSHCAVCFVAHELVNKEQESRVANKKEFGLDMLFCSGCGQAVHGYCYGVQDKETEKKKDETNDFAFSLFKCDACKAGKENPNEQVISCPFVSN